MSRFLNGPASLSPARAEQVRRAIAELGYKPHGAARALASRRTGAIGAIVPTLDGAIFAAVLQELQRYVVEAGMTLMVGSSNFDAEQEREQVDNMVVRGIDGMMLTGEDRSPDVYETLAADGVRFVNAYVYHPGSPHPCVGFDNAGAMQRLIGYLWDLGHRRFGMVAGITRGNDRARERLAGAREGLAERGATFVENGVVERPYSIAAGRNGMRALMTLSQPPTAVMCGNDILALGALLEAQSMGLSVPKDVSVTGFDDLAIAQEIAPRLTTIHAPVEQMGWLAANYLLGKESESEAPFQRCLAADLVVRDSTAPPK